MPEESLQDEAPQTPWEPSYDLDETPPKPTSSELKADDRPLSTLSLATAGVAAFNFLLTIACVIAWMVNEDTGLAIVSASNGLWILLGIAAIGLGGYSQRVQKNDGYRGGTAGIVATAALLSGMFIMCAAVMIPLLSAMREMVEPVS